MHCWNVAAAKVKAYYYNIDTQLIDGTLWTAEEYSWGVRVQGCAYALNISKSPRGVASAIANHDVLDSQESKFSLHKFDISAIKFLLTNGSLERFGVKKWQKESIPTWWLIFFLIRI